jgi:hypothetical protein
MSKIMRLGFTWWRMLDIVLAKYLKLLFQHQWPDRLLKTKVLTLTWRNAIKRLTWPTKSQKLTLMSLPYEIRLAIYDMICWPDPTNASTPGVLTLLLLNRKISQEARPFVEHIPHTVILADGCQLESNSEIWGMPRSIDASFHHSIKRLVLVLSVCSIGKTSRDTFDVNIPKTSRFQWRLLKSVVGIWPEVRESPLEEVRISLRASTASADIETYRAELMRYIRTFKRTHVWAESGDCKGKSRKGSRSSLVLPLARAFNEARGNWVEGATIDDNLYVRFGEQRLEGSQNEKMSEEWAVQPSEDTSRTDRMEYPPLTEFEEEYIRSKVQGRVCSEEIDLCCGTCLARFYDRRVYLDHVANT